MSRLLAPLLVAVIVGLVWLPDMARSDALDVKRPKVKLSTRVRTAPTLPSKEEEELDSTPPAHPDSAPPAHPDSGWEDYYRDKADYYRDKRKKEREYRSGGSCMYGADGTVIHAPPGRDC